MRMSRFKNRYFVCLIIFAFCWIFGEREREKSLRSMRGVRGIVFALASGWRNNVIFDPLLLLSHHFLSNIPCKRVEISQETGSIPRCMIFRLYTC